MQRTVFNWETVLFYFINSFLFSPFYNNTKVTVYTKYYDDN